MGSRGIMLGRGWTIVTLAVVIGAVLMLLGPQEVQARRKSSKFSKQATGAVDRAKFRNLRRRVAKEPRLVFLFPGFWKCMGDQICAKWYIDPSEGKELPVKDDDTNNGECVVRNHCFSDGKDQGSDQCNADCSNGEVISHERRSMDTTKLKSHCERPDCKKKSNHHFCYCQTDCRAGSDGRQNNPSICSDIDCEDEDNEDAAKDYRCMQQDTRNQMRHRRRNRILRRMAIASIQGDEASVIKGVRHLQHAGLMSDPADGDNRTCTGNMLDYFCRSLHAPIRCTYYCLTNWCNSPYMQLELDYQKNGGAAGRQDGSDSSDGSASRSGSNNDKSGKGDKNDNQDNTDVASIRRAQKARKEERYMKRMMNRRYGMRKRKAPIQDRFAKRCIYLLGIPVIAPFYIGCWLADIAGFVLFT